MKQAQTVLPAIQSPGSYLRRERELRAISLEEVAQATRIPLGTLRALESDQFEQLPGEVFVRGFWKSYARAVGVENEAIIDRFRGVPANGGARLVVGSISGVETGRRFGLAVALVVLVILFTLALAIAMRPRPNIVPVELSQSNYVVEGSRAADSA